MSCNININPASQKRQAFPVLQVRAQSRLQSGTPEPRADHHRPRRPTPGALEVSPMRLPKKGFLYPFQPELQTLSLTYAL